MSSEPLSGTFSGTVFTSTQSTVETCIQQWLKSAGLNWDGHIISSETKRSQSHPFTDITLTALCARSSGMEAITVVNLKLSVLNQNSPSAWYEAFSQSISPPSLPMSDGNSGFKDKSTLADTLHRLVDESVSFGDAGMILTQLERRLRLIRKGPLPTS